MCMLNCHAQTAIGRTSSWPVLVRDAIFARLPDRLRAPPHPSMDPYQLPVSYVSAGGSREKVARSGPGGHHLCAGNAVVGPSAVVREPDLAFREANVSRRSENSGDSQIRKTSPPRPAHVDWREVSGRGCSVTTWESWALK